MIIYVVLLLLQVWDYMMLTEQFAESSPLLREQVCSWTSFKYGATL